MSRYEQGWADQHDRRDSRLSAAACAIACAMIAALISLQLLQRCGQPMRPQAAQASLGPCYRKRQRGQGRRPKTARRRRAVGTVVAIHLDDASGWRQIAAERKVAHDFWQARAVGLEDERRRLIDAIAHNAQELVQQEQLQRKAELRAARLERELEDERRARQDQERQSGERITTLLGELQVQGQDLAGWELRAADSRARLEFSERARKAWQARALGEGRRCPGCRSCQPQRQHGADLCAGSGWCAPGGPDDPLCTRCQKPLGTVMMIDGKGHMHPGCDKVLPLGTVPGGIEIDDCAVHSKPPEVLS